MEPERSPIDITDVDLGGDIVIVTDGDGTIVDVNHAFVRVTGYPKSEAIGQTPRLLNSGLQGPEIYRELWETVKAGKVWSGELIDRHRDGALRTHRVVLTPFTSPAGHITHIVAVQRDLNAADLHRGTVTGVGALHTDREERCVYADLEAARLLGAPTQDVYADGWQGLLPDDDVVAVRECLRAAMTTGRGQRTDVRTPDGRWLHLVIDPLPGGQGQIIGASWVIEDFTERMAGHARLARRDAVMTGLLESFREPVAVVESDGTVITINSAWARGERRSHPALAAAVGDDLIAVLRNEARSGSPSASDLGGLISKHLSCLPAPDPARAGLRLTPLQTEHGGLIIHLDAVD